MKIETLNAVQLLINTLKEGVNINRYYCFSPEDAKVIINCIDLFCDIERRYIKISFWNDPVKDQTIALKVYNKDIWDNKELITYFSEDEKTFISSLKRNKVPQNLRYLIFKNFM